MREATIAIPHRAGDHPPAEQARWATERNTRCQVIRNCEKDESLIAAALQQEVRCHPLPMKQTRAPLMDQHLIGSGPDNPACSRAEFSPDIMPVLPK